MNYFYKVEMTIDEEKVLADGQELDDVYDDLCSCFYNDCFQKERSGSVFTFGTLKKEKCGMMWYGISSAYKSWLKPYFKAILWYIEPLGIVENILAEWYADYAYKFEIIVDEEKVLAEGKKTDEVYAAIDRYFREDGMQKRQEGSLVTYYTMVKEVNDVFLQDVIFLYDSELRSYIKSALWYNALTDNLPENAFKTLAKRGR